MTCAKAQEFLAPRKIDVAETVNAKKTTYTKDEALALAKTVDVIHSVKGKKVATLDLKRSTPDEDALLELLLGPTGNLRAPTLRIGRTLLVGFEPGLYADALK